jgi:histidyl-tRNA synthetase
LRSAVVDGVTEKIIHIKKTDDSSVGKKIDLLQATGVLHRRVRQRDDVCKRKQESSCTGECRIDFYFVKFFFFVTIRQMAKFNVSTPSGFPEFTPAQERERQRWIGVIKSVFERHGFPQIDTPLVERAENFTAKGGNPKEIYILDRLLREDAIDQDKDQRAIRFDHTVPLALYVARHFNDLTFPFRRSAIGPVMRGERAQKGRFRQFDQCDIDVIGNGKLSLLNDAQMVAIIVELFEELMPDQKFVVRINNRKILMGLHAFIGGKIGQEKDTFNFLDGLEKVSNISDMKTELPKDFIEPLLEFIKIKELAQTKTHPAMANELFAEGVEELESVVESLENMGVQKSHYIVDLGIARGLDYYTGTVYETNLIGYEGLGSVCSGGRYDDLAKVFTNKDLPGVGISIGLTRLLWQLFNAEIIKPTQATSCDVIVLTRGEEYMKEALEIGKILRDGGIKTENYLENKKTDKQIDHARKKGIPIGVIIGKDIMVENFERKEQKESSKESVVQTVQSFL